MTYWLWRIRTEWSLYQRKRARKVRSIAAKQGWATRHKAAVRHGVAG